MIAGAALVAACTEGPTAPRYALQAGAARSGDGWVGTANARKYRDSGIKPASGRAGSAAATAIALVSGTGQTALAVTAFPSDLVAPAGTIRKVQVRAYAPDGTQLFARNYLNLATNPFTATYAGLVPGVSFVVQAQVSGIDGRRVDVVTVAGVPVVRSPDLAVLGVGAPVTAVAGMPTVVSATVGELNGDVGARTDCVLYVDGVEADRAHGVWVDAGDVVSCAFTTAFAITGIRALTVRAEGVNPADFDGGNNAAGAALQVIAPVSGPGTPAVRYMASVSDLTFAVRDSFLTRWTYAPGGQLFQEIRSDRDSSGRLQDALYTATVGAPLTFPVTRVEVAQATGGQLLHAARYDAVAADPGSSSGTRCVARGVGTGVELYLCSYQAGYASVTYLRRAGTVTYHSTDYSSFWNGASYDTDTWVLNGTATLGPAAPFGASYSFDVKLTDGATVYDLGASVPLGPVVVSDIEPQECGTFQFSFGPDTFDALTCVSFSYVATGVGGSVSGSGVPGQAPMP